MHREPDGTTLLYIDRHLVHEVTSPQAFEGLKLAHRTPRRVERSELREAREIDIGVVEAHARQPTPAPARTGSRVRDLHAESPAVLLGVGVVHGGAQQLRQS